MRKNVKCIPKVPPVIPQKHPANEIESDTIERNKYIFEQINRWIENADNKVSISCGVFTGVFGIVTFLAERFIIIPTNPDINICWNNIYKICIVLSLVVMVIAVVFYALAITPNLKSNKKQDTSPKQYPVFFGDIHSLRLEEYQKLVSKGDEIDFNDELIRENWHNSHICMKKMERYRTGVKLSMIAIFLALVSLGAHYLTYNRFLF